MKDFIEIYDNALSSDECEKIVDYINGEELERGVFGSPDEVVIDPQFKDSWEEKDNHFRRERDIDVLLHARLMDYTKRYRENHPQVDYINKWYLDITYNLQKYDPGGGYFGNHCESDGYGCMHRMLVWMIYLNTVTDGGGTRFDNYDRIVDAVQGRLVIWPAFLTHHHHGIMSKTQTKMIATGWFHFALTEKVREELLQHKYVKE